jgi:DNA polymerase-3 subunit beta
LQEGLAMVAASIPSKTTLPVLANILIETTDKGIRLSGTDLDIAVSTEVTADVDVAGAVTIPAKKLTEIARELMPSPVKVATAGEQRVTLECGQSKFKLLGIPRDEFPTFPSVRFADAWRIRSADLHQLISHTVFAVSTEESRPILNGVLWELRPDHMRMVATNGHRLAKMDVPIAGGSAASSDLIVPPKALDQVRRLFPAEEDLEIARGENHLGFRSPLTSVFTRLIEGPYPPYDRVIPRDNDRIAIIDKASLSGALRRMVIVASDQTHRIRMSLNTGMVKFSVQTPDLGEAQDELAIRYTGDPLDIGFNASYLLEILRNMPTEDVRMTFKAPDNAATIEPEGWTDPAKYLCLVMPLRLVD